MFSRKRLLRMLVLAALTLLSRPCALLAQPKPNATPAAEKTAKDAESGSTDKLSLEQQRIADKYKHLEDVLLRMAELNAATDPRRAALLKKAVAQSKDKLIAVQLDRLVEMLGKDQLSKALENQKDVDQDLRAILELLMSENRAKRIESEKARIREFLKRINGIIKQEKDIQGRTAGGDDPKRLAGEQQKVAGKTGELAKDVQKNEEQKAEGGKEGGEGKPEGEKGEPSKEQNDKKDGGKDKGKNDQGKKSQGEKGEGGKGQGSPEKSEDAKGQEQSKPSATQSSVRKRLEAAEQRMKEADAKLKEAERQGAVEKQEEAIRQLQTAKAQLEEILRQLREEEIERVLAMLEARFRKMLQMQEEVYDGTVRLDKVPQAERTHNHEIEASRLSGKETQIVVEIDKALLLLRDDGSAMAFLEASEQMRDDMQQVVERLAQVKLGKMTQNLEEDILAALKEMIEALKKAQKDQAARKTPPGQAPPPGQPQDPPLVDVLSELKMIRALQMRVNTRTARFTKMLDGEQADNAELVGAIRTLAERQRRIFRITSDLQMGKNQ